ncbi:MAG TPA: hypothetical protein VEU52_10035, partial [Candidatus Limnocylindrales bacterium]|nr:hypothetical protein [Candidatus Limnocylindrales bacterium]
LTAAIRSGYGYEGTDEYAPLGCDRYTLPGSDWPLTGGALFQIPPASEGATPPNPRIAELDGETEKLLPTKSVKLSIETWSAEHKVFTAATARPVKLAVRLINYPAWVVFVDGTTAHPESLEKTAQMILPLSAGTHRVEIRFRRTWDRTAGAGISAFSALGLLVFVFFKRRRN